MNSNSNTAQKTRAPAGRLPIKTGLALTVLACGLCAGAGCIQTGVWPPPSRAQYGRRPAVANRAGGYASSVQQIESAGPRFGLVLATGDARDNLKAAGKDALMTAWGWQFEYKFLETEEKGGVEGLIELVPLVIGLEQDMSILSLNALAGFRFKDGFEFAVGPNLTGGETPSGFGFLTGSGNSAKSSRARPLAFSNVMTSSMRRSRKRKLSSRPCVSSPSQ